MAFSRPASPDRMRHEMPHDPYDESQIPAPVLGRAQELLSEALADPRKCGLSTLFEGYTVETHTLGCRSEAGDAPEDEWDQHYKIWDDYTSDGKSWVIGDPGDGVFVTITPTRKLGAKMGNPAKPDPEIYYVTKEGDDDWTVHGRRHHLKVVRTEGPSGREDRNGQEIYQTIYLVKGPGTPGVHAPIDLSDQFEIEPHGFTRLKDATAYAREKLFLYDERVDPVRPRH